MRFIPPERWRWAVPAYAVAGAAIGFIPWPVVALYTGWRTGVGVMLAVNIVLPAVAVVMAFLYPRSWSSLVGGLLLGLGWTIGAMFRNEPHFWLWNTGFLLNVTSPILLAATVGYSIIGLITAAVAGTFRRVGLPDEHLRCSACGYLLTGVEPGPCPECGRAASV